MFRLTEHEVAAEAAEMDLIAHHTGAGRHDRGHGVEGVRRRRPVDIWWMKQMYGGVRSMVDSVPSVGRSFGPYGRINHPSTPHINIEHRPTHT